MTFFDPLYQALASLGFTDPLHPPLAHLPIGLAAAALIFGLGALALKRPLLKVSAQHCLILAWLFFFPTVMLGYTDWQHYYGGVWVSLIVTKIWLTVLLFLLLSLGVILIFTGRGESRAILVIYLLCFFTVVWLGYCGGRLVFGGPAHTAPRELRAGKKIYEIHCQGCHPNGGNTLKAQYPVIGSSKLSDFSTFIKFIRAPHLPDGARGIMPALPPAKLSEAQARDLYRYLRVTFCQAGEKEAAHRR